MPEWMAAVAGDPKHGGEAQQLWREHQEFRAAFSSPEEARAVKELFAWRRAGCCCRCAQATQSVDRIDAALFSGDARAQSEVVAELARANPAAFRSMFAEAAKVLAGMGQSVSDCSVSSDGAMAGTRAQQDRVIPNEVRNLSSIDESISAGTRQRFLGQIDGPRE